MAASTPAEVGDALVSRKLAKQARTPNAKYQTPNY
jgi:hypothetical protein